MHSAFKTRPVLACRTLVGFVTPQTLARMHVDPSKVPGFILRNDCLNCIDKSGTMHCALFNCRLFLCSEGVAPSWLLEIYFPLLQVFLRFVSGSSGQIYNVIDHADSCVSGGSDLCVNPFHWTSLLDARPVPDLSLMWWLPFWIRCTQRVDRGLCESFHRPAASPIL